MSRTFIILFLSLLKIAIGKPGLFDFIDNCNSITDPNVCAILYDDENCNEGDWTPYRVKVHLKEFSVNILYIYVVGKIHNIVDLVGLFTYMFIIVSIDFRLENKKVSPF